MQHQTSELTGSLEEEFIKLSKTLVFGLNIEIHCAMYPILHFLLPGDMGPKMRVVIASSGSRLPTDTTDVGLFPSVYLQRGSFLLQLSSATSYLQMVGQIVTPWELLMAVLTFVIPVTRKTCTSCGSINPREEWGGTYHSDYWTLGKSHVIVAQHLFRHWTPMTQRKQRDATWSENRN